MYIMPNASPIIRAMKWSSRLKLFPDTISSFLPEGDPVKNHEKIKLEIERLKILGPKGRIEMERYLNDEITEEEYESNLDAIIKSYNTKEFEQLRLNLSYIENQMEYNLYRHILPFVSTFNMDDEKFIKSIKNINQLYNQNKEKSNIKTRIMYLV